jgi:ribosomal protein L6P/L9E
VKEKNTFFFESSVQNVQKLCRWSLILLNFPRSFEQPFRKELVLKGLGYKGCLKDDKSCVELKLGFSHLISFNKPKDVLVKINKQFINLEGFNRTSVGNLVSNIRQFRLPTVTKERDLV